MIFHKISLYLFCLGYNQKLTLKFECPYDFRLIAVILHYPYDGGLFYSIDTISYSSPFVGVLIDAYEAHNAFQSCIRCHLTPLVNDQQKARSLKKAAAESEADSVRLNNWRTLIILWIQQAVTVQNSQSRGFANEPRSHLYARVYFDYSHNPNFVFSRTYIELRADNAAKAVKNSVSRRRVIERN